MSQEAKVTFRISAAAAPYVGTDKPREQRLKAATGKVPLPPEDLVLLVFYLCHDPDPEVKRTALDTLRGLDLPLLSRLLANPELHPRILDALARLHYEKEELAQAFAAHPALDERTAAFLAAKGVYSLPSPEPEPEPEPETEPDPAAPQGEPRAQQAAPRAMHAEEEFEEPVQEEDEKFQSKYQLCQEMGIGEKIKMAMTGDKEWRGILIKDSNKLVSGAVVKNPRLTENEVLAIAKSAVQNDEIIRVICANKEWVKNPQIRKALAENSKTPLPLALRFVTTLSERELSFLAKNKNVSSVIASQARRILLSKKNG